MLKGTAVAVCAEPNPSLGGLCTEANKQAATRWIESTEWMS
jgi:hypothetical protein